MKMRGGKKRSEEGVVVIEATYVVVVALLMIVFLMNAGLYLCGELLDVDGRCGGYNLQWAWTSGQIAGTAAAREE